MSLTLVKKWLMIVPLSGRGFNCLLNAQTDAIESCESSHYTFLFSLKFFSLNTDSKSSHTPCNSFTNADLNKGSYSKGSVGPHISGVKARGKSPQAMGLGKYPIAIGLRLNWLLCEEHAVRTFKSIVVRAFSLYVPVVVRWIIRGLTSEPIIKHSVA